MQGIPQQVVQDLLQAIRVRVHGEGGGGRIHLQRHLIGPGQGLEGAGHLGQDLIHGQLLAHQGQLACLGLGQLVQVGDQPGEQPGLLVDPPDLLPLQRIDPV